MRYLMMVKSSGRFGPSPPALMEAIGQLTAEGFRDGYLLDTGGLGPGRFVQVRGGQVDVTDGPFTEAKEVVGGFSFLDARSLEEATELGARLMQLHVAHWPGWEGELEIRPVFGPGDVPGSPTLD
jgi:hypothetical protein